MSGPGEKLALRALLCLDPETAHGLTHRALRAGLVRRGHVPSSPRLAVELAGLWFANPLGVAAGFDKNGEVVGPMLRLGFGFTEVGTVTPLPQPGNPRPRVFRLAGRQAVINRYGFNNEGHAAAHQRLVRLGNAGIVGVNIGANKDSTDRIADYVAGIGAFADCASYLTVNVSSPNTPGLRDLQDRGNLERLVAAVAAERDRRAAAGRRMPVFVKVAPDLDEAGLEDVCRIVPASGLDGLIISNTTLARAGTEGERHAGEAGGLSGRPLFARSTIVLARARRRLGPDFPIIGVGGVSDADGAWAKIRAGANLVQLYTGLVYKGPSLVGDILAGLIERLDASGLGSIGEAVGTEVDVWAERGIPPVT